MIQKIISLTAFLLLSHLVLQAQDPKVTWDHLYGVAVDHAGNDLVKIPYTVQNPYETGRAISVDVLQANTDGYFTYLVDDNDVNRLLGFSQDLGLDEVEYMEHGFFLSGGDVYILNEGELIGSYGGYEDGTELKMEREEDRMYYYKDGDEIEVLDVDEHKEFKIKAILYDDGAAFNNVTSNLATIVSNSLHKTGVDLNYNWSYNESYDHNGTVISAGKQYVDQLGRNAQTMSKNFDKNKVIAAQTIYDTYGRPAVNTLPAPIGEDMVLKTNFLTNTAGDVYQAANFDESGTLNNPDPVSNNIPNTLGNYYSDYGSEAYQSTTAYPYSRIEYMADPTGRVKRSASPGENFKMGSGHESRVFYMFTGGELDRAFGVDSSFYCEINPNNRLLSSALNNTQIIAEKTISIDAEGKVAISFVSDGLNIATAVSGITSGPTVPEQTATNKMLYEGTRSVDIHLPESKSTTLNLPLPTYHVPLANGVDGQTTELTVLAHEINFSLMDLETNKLLVLGTDYNLDVSTRDVTFLGTNKHRFLRISYEFTNTELTYFNNNGITPPDASITYKLDYSHFTVNYYDLTGRLRANVSPKGFDYTVNGKHTEYSRYDYGSYGQLIAQQTPDEGLTEFLHSDEGMVRFSQNAQQRVDNKFSYVRYDDYNRTIESGEYNEAGGSYVFDNYYATTNATSLKNIVDDVTYAFTGNTSDQNYIAYDVLASTDEIPTGYFYKNQYPQHNLKGAVSKTWNENNQTWYSYDYAGRPEYLVQQLMDADFHNSANETVKTVEFTYSPVSSLLLKEKYQKNHELENVITEYVYNKNQQLVSVVAQNLDEVVYGEAAFEYYTNGQLKRKELGGNLQGVDYAYTLHGQLKSMNHATLNSALDPGMDGDENGEHGDFLNDLFGFALDYYQGDYQRTGVDLGSSITSSANGYYNGLIKANRWRIKEQNEIVQTAGNTTLYNEGDVSKTLMYNYNYDDFYRFETAVFGVFDNGSAAFADREDYKVYGSSANQGVDYDIIGNIKALKRNGYVGNGSTPPSLLMDDLEYGYNAGTSQLNNILDQTNNSGYTTDFKTAATGDQFTYNNMGQMTASVADEVSGIVYYPNGQVKEVTFDNGNKAEYFYNERGIKIKSKFTDVQPTTPTIKTNWYITDAKGALRSVHEKVDAAPVSMTSQVIYGGGRLGIRDVANEETIYEHTDHLGNVRVTFKDLGGGDLATTSWTDYYPFGEAMPGRSLSGVEEPMYGYQGQERVGNGSKWYNFNLRMYNPSIGRFNTIDPYSQFNSPYLAMANNPISFVDPDGGRAVLTGRQREKLLIKLSKEKHTISRIEYLRRFMTYTQTNHYNGITLEGFYAAVGRGLARGIGAATRNSNSLGQGIIQGDIDNAVNAYLGPLGTGFLDAALSLDLGIEYTAAEADESKRLGIIAQLASIDIFGDIANNNHLNEAGKLRRARKKHLQNQERQQKLKEDSQHMNNAGDIVAGGVSGDDQVGTSIDQGSELTASIGELNQNKGGGKTIRQDDIAPGSVKSNEFEVGKKSYFKFSNLSHEDKVEFLDEGGNILFNVTGKNGNNTTYKDQPGNYFKFGTTVKMSDIVKANNGVRFHEIQIRVTGNPNKPTRWSYQPFKATETHWRQSYYDPRFL